MRTKEIFFTLIFLAALIFYFIYMAPLMADNFVFSHDITPGFAQFYSGAPLDSVKPMSVAAAFRQAAEMYETWCGRYAGNLAVYLLFMLPRWFYALLASAGFAIYIFMLHICVFGRQWRSNLSSRELLVIAALVWLSLPSFGEAFFWLSVGGELALIGQAAIFIPLRFALDDSAPVRRNPVFTILCCVLFFFGGMLACSLDYPTSAVLPPTAIACCLWLYFRNKPRNLPVLPLSGAFGLCVGGYFTIAAPGNACRLALSHDPSVLAYASAGWGERIIGWLGHLPLAIAWQIVPLGFLVFGCLLLWREHGKNFIRFIPFSAYLFLLPAILTCCSYLFTAWPPPRAFATSSAQLVVCSLIVFHAAAGRPPCVLERRLRLAGWFVAIFCVFSVCYEGVKFYNLHMNIQAREAIIAADHTGNVELQPLPPNIGDRYQVLGKYLPDLSADPTFWVNRAMSAHYGLDKIALAKRETVLSTPEGQHMPATRIHGDRIGVFFAGNAPENVHYYYYGAPALLASLPAWLADPVFHWLAKGKRGDWRLLLAPVLLAREDIQLSGGRGVSIPLKLFADRLWLVNPQKDKYSFDLFPLESIQP